MADTTRDPPPLFDDEPSTKEDDGDDLFSSAVQSPVNGHETPDMSKTTASEVILESSGAGDGSSAISSDVLVPQPISSDPLQSGSVEADQGRNVQSPAPNSSSSELQPNEGARPASLSVIDDDSFEGPSSLSSLGVTGISNLQPVPRNMYNISSMGDVEDVTNSMDLFESCVEDAVVRPFAAASITGPQQEVSLDDDDDGLFSGGAFDKTQLKTSAPAAPTTAVLPPMGAPLTPPAAAVAPAIPAASAAVEAATIASTTSNITTPPLPTAAVGLPATGFYSPAPAAASSLNMVSTGAASSKEFIEIVISEPQKVGDGMNSYMAYKMTINTNIPFFKKQSWSVTRRFSDYLGLHSKLVEKHLHAGRIIPPAPEKDALNATKLRLSSSSDGVEGAAEFLERRRAALQRYMQRTAALPHLRSDPDFREFIELESELPRATQTSAMSGAGVMRLFNRVGETVNKMTFKMEESDTWFEERVHQVEALETELRRLHAALESLAGGRRELAMSSINLSKAAAVLSSVEEHSALNRALHQLSEATDRTHTVYHAQADADFYILCETTRDYINLIGAVKEVFHERVKVFQAWQYSQTMLAKKRDYKAKLELTARQEKVAQAQQEVEEWEGKVERNQEHFERISAAIKKELEQFDAVRVQDFKMMFIRYLESMVTSQQQVIRVWESFLPEAKAIS